MEIRRLIEDDALAMWQFRLTAVETDPWSFVESPEELRNMPVEEFADRLRAGPAENFVMGAFDQSRLVGTVGFYQEILAKRRHKGTIWGVFVLPAAREQGLARKLMVQVIESAKEIPGLDQILLTVSISQQAARHLYESLGFRSIGIEPRGIKIGAQAVDEEHMVLSLAP